MIKVSVVATLVLLALCIPVTASAFDRLVNPNGTCPPSAVPTYATIQDAVDNSAAGDEIGVCPGSYTEDVAVGTPDLSLVAIGHVLLTPAGPNPCFNVISNGVHIRGFEIALCSSGIRLVASLGVLENNFLHDNDIGIIVLGEDNLVRNNLIQDSTETGISVNSGSAGTVVRNNTVRGNAVYGILVAADGGPGTPVTVTKNLVQDSDTGIHVRDSTFGVLSFNSVTFNHIGILLTDIDQYVIMRNNVSRSVPGPDCVWDGLGNNTFIRNNCRTEVPPGAW